jgi:predicted GTPase
MGQQHQKSHHFKQIEFPPEEPISRRSSIQRLLRKSASSETPKLTNVVFLGIPGSGKSTLCNLFTQTNNFKTGTGEYHELITKKCQSMTYEGYRVIDTPGLSSEQIDLCAEEFKKAFSQNGKYIIIFVASFSNTFFGSNERSMLRLVANSLRSINNLTIGIVINRFWKNDNLPPHDTFYKSFLNACFPIKPIQQFLFLIAKGYYSHDEDYQLGQELYGFVSELPINSIRSSQVSDFNTNNWDLVSPLCDEVTNIRKYMRKVRKSDAKIDLSFECDQLNILESRLVDACNVPSDEV